ncbi:hypothetical protein EV421DRAFT_1733452 [Armillaria borealis]|uniref:Uncharacterized protein n=1 Tax=Armillaria borealis TaxID=47425 RepID=A0AA39JRV1_9AGAR|nr:hypothetical protein EV421DRAFT_1733452 [Armillaria borealis]
MLTIDNNNLRGDLVNERLQFILPEPENFILCSYYLYMSMHLMPAISLHELQRRGPTRGIKRFSSSPRRVRFVGIGDSDEQPFLPLYPRDYVLLTDILIEIFSGYNVTPWSSPGTTAAVLPRICIFSWKKFGLGTARYQRYAVWTTLFYSSPNAPPSLPKLSPSLGLIRWSEHEELRLSRYVEHWILDGFALERSTSGCIFGVSKAAHMAIRFRARDVVHAMHLIPRINHSVLHAIHPNSSLAASYTVRKFGYMCDEAWYSDTLNYDNLGIGGPQSLCFFRIPPRPITNTNISDIDDSEVGPLHSSYMICCEIGRKGWSV